MSKLVTSEYGSTKEILKFPSHYVALPVMVKAIEDVGVKEIVPRGTLVKGDGGAVLLNLDKPVVDALTPAKPASAVLKESGGDDVLKLTTVEAGGDLPSYKVTVTIPSTQEDNMVLTYTAGSHTLDIQLATSDTSKTATTEVDEIVTEINKHATIKLLFVAEALGDGDEIPAEVAPTGTSFTGGAAASVTGVEGILMNDIDVTYGNKEGAMLIHGFIAIDKMPYDEQNEVAAALADAALEQVQFIK